MQLIWCLFLMCVPDASVLCVTAVLVCNVRKQFFSGSVTYGTSLMSNIERHVHRLSQVYPKELSCASEMKLWRKYEVNKFSLNVFDHIPFLYSSIDM